jgi:hypothetical protein
MFWSLAPSRADARCAWSHRERSPRFAAVREHQRCYGYGCNTTPIPWKVDYSFMVRTQTGCGIAHKFYKHAKRVIALVV